MKIRGVTLGFALICLATVALAEPAEKAAQHFAEGNALLAQADFEGALRAYKAAVEADPDNDDYRAQAALLRRAMKLRETLDEEVDRAKWAAKARGLYTFYMQNNVIGEAVALANKVHAQQQTAESAAMLARARLAAGENAAAADELRALPESQRDAEVRVLLGLALAREGQTAEAEGLLEQLELPPEPRWPLLFDLARAHARLGHRDPALGYLTRCFENTPPSWLDTLKQQARTSDDFAGLHGTPAFAKALRTASKVKGGCGGCGGKAGGCKKSCSHTDKSTCDKEKKEGCAGAQKSGCTGAGHKADGGKCQGRDQTGPKHPCGGKNKDDRP